MPERLARNSSHVALTRNTSKAALKRNWSTQGVSNKAHSRAEKPTRRASSLSREKSGGARRQASVHFDLGDDDGGEEGWTEVSNSESPTATRPNSQAASHLADSDGVNEDLPTPEPSGTVPRLPLLSNPHPQSQPESESQPESQPPSQSRSRTDSRPSFESRSPPPSPSPNGQLQSPAPTKESPLSSTHRTPSRPSYSTPHRQRASSPDPHVITERLLQRHPRHNAPPQMSSVSATVTPVNHSPRSAAQNQSSPASANALTSSGHKESMISRFLPSSKNASKGSSDSPRTTSVGGSMSPARTGFDGPARNQRLVEDGDDLSRAKSTTHLPPRLQASQHDRDRDRSASPSPSALASRPKNHHPSNPSRIQQKLWLQRASSNIEQQHLRPGNGAVGGGGRGKGGSNKGDPRAPRQFDRATLEYKVVRRYKNPLGDAINRVRQMQAPAGKDKDAKKRYIFQQKQARHGTPATGEGKLGLSQSLREGGPVGGIRMAGSSRGKDNAGATERSEQDELRRTADDTTQILRRMWERGQEEGVAGGD